MLHTIYKLTFPNGKVYIGQTRNFKERVYKHNYNSHDRNNKYYTKFLYKAIRKYGWENVTKEIIKRCKESRVDFWEQKFIKQFRSIDRKFGYNLDSGGNKQKIRSKSTIEKIIIKKRKPILQIDANTGKIIRSWDSATQAGKKLKLAESGIGKACAEKISYATCGGFIWIFKKDYSLELLKNKLIEAEIRRDRKLKKCYKPILQINKDTGEIIKEWEYMRKASKALGIKLSIISRVCAGNKIKDSKGFYYIPQTAGGFKWKLKNK